MKTLIIDNDHYIFYQGKNNNWLLTHFLPDGIAAPHWYIGPMTERRVRSKGTNLALIPLIHWEVQDNGGNWSELKVPKDLWNTKYFDLSIFTLNVTIEHGKKKQKVVYSSDKYSGSPVNDGRMELENVKKIARINQMRVYDELLKLEIVENKESLR